MDKDLARLKAIVSRLSTATGQNEWSIEALDRQAEREDCELIEKDGQVRLVFREKVKPTA